MKGLFGRKRRAEPSKRRKNLAPIDEEETIVINLTSEETLDPNEIRVEMDSGRAGASPAGATAQPKGPVTPPGTSTATQNRRPDGGPPDPGTEHPSSAPERDDGETTQIWTVGGAAPQTSPQRDTADPFVEPTTVTTPADGASRPLALDPALTAGLLLIVEGEGGGRLFGVSLGRNKLGRGADNEIQIDNGDDAITRSNHATIAADPKTRRVFLVPGNSTNIAYLDEEPLLEPKEIDDKATIQLGETRLIFMKIFGNYLDWP